jgi:hypothetical protein
VVSILVLLEVSFRQMHSVRFSHRRRRFNPCFIGSIFQTVGVVCKRPLVVLFQSLFYWKYLSDLFFSRLRCSLNLFQSLFYWKYLSDQKPHHQPIPG